MILLYIGPVAILLVLGAASIYLTYSGLLSGRTHIGWALLGVAAAVFLTSVVWHSGTGEIGYGTIALVFYIVFLSIFFALQGPLLLELITMTILTDPSKGLKILKVHTVAERKVTEDDLPGAIAEYERIITDDPEDFEARFRLAELCSENEQYAKAAAVYEMLFEHAKDLSTGQHCSALTRLAEIYARHLGDVNAARRYIQTIIETYPDTKYAGYARDRLSTL